MSDRITRIRTRNPIGPAPHRVAAISDYGRKTRAEMINIYRAHYQRQIERAQAALTIPDDELIVETYLGPWAMKNKEEVTE